jgi:signal transduction histidine kinase
MQDYLSLLQLERLELTPHELEAVVQAWATEWQVLAEARGVKLEVEGLEQLGTVALHPSTLRRAVRNLALNTLEAMPQDGTVTLAGQGRATEVQLHVCDGDSGIPAEQLPWIFDPLYTIKPGGTGLGLYIVQQIVAAHREQVRMESLRVRAPRSRPCCRVLLPNKCIKAHDFVDLSEKAGASRLKYVPALSWLL